MLVKTESSLPDEIVKQVGSSVHSYHSVMTIAT